MNLKTTFPLFQWKRGRNKKFAHLIKMGLYFWTKLHEMSSQILPGSGRYGFIEAIFISTTDVSPEVNFQIVSLDSYPRKTMPRWRPMKNVSIKSYICTHAFQLKNKDLGLLLHSFLPGNIWTVTWDFQQCGTCDQHSLRSACAYTQSDQSLASPVKLLTEQHLEFLSLNGDYTGSSESTLVKMPHCWKSHVTAHLVWYLLEESPGELRNNDMHLR